MNQRQDVQLPNGLLCRRDFLHAVAAGLALASAGAGSLDGATAGPTSDNDKRKARYRASSPEVQYFYRVNRYPGH